MQEAQQVISGFGMGDLRVMKKEEEKWDDFEVSSLCVSCQEIVLVCFDEQSQAGGNTFSFSHLDVLLHFYPQM